VGEGGSRFAKYQRAATEEFMNHTNYMDNIFMSTMDMPYITVCLHLKSHSGGDNDQLALPQSQAKCLGRNLSYVFRTLPAIKARQKTLDIAKCVIILFKCVVGDPETCVA
jgi:hypothetical protein